MADQSSDGRSKRAKKRAARNQDRVFRDDFERVKPTKIVPGVVGRSAWFAERAGRFENALSISRLLQGVRVADELLDEDAARRRVADAAAAFLDTLAADDGSPLEDKPTLVDPNGRHRSVTPTRRAPARGLSAVSRPLPSKTGGLLLIPVDDQTAELLDLDSVVGADMTDPAQPKLNMTFTYLAQHRRVVGEVTEGVHQVFALPKDPWLRVTLETLSRHWKWVERDPLIRKIAGERGADLGPRMLDRICQLILCAPDFARIDDPGVFDGIGLPPGGLGPRGDLCERCLGDLIGDVDVVDDLIVRPPIVSWCWIRRPRCSRWFSIGPVPDSTFGGIGRVTQIAAHPTDSGVVIAGAAGGGVWRTDNAGASWRPLMELEPTLTIGAVAFAPSNPSTIYAASGEDAGTWNPAWAGVGVYRSTNGGADWTLMTPVTSTRFSAIVVHPKRPDVIYVAGNRGLHKSVDGGVTWRTNPGMSSLFDGQITDVVIAYEPQVLLPAAFDALDAFPAIFDGRPPVFDLSTVVPFGVERVYIGVRNDGVYRSDTGGQQFGATPAFERLDGPGQLPSGASAGWTKLTIGRRGPNRQRFLAAKLGSSGSRIFVTTDGGDSWDERAVDVATVSFDEWCSVIAVDPTDEDVLYAGAAGQLKRTTNGGAAAGDWTSINVGVHSDQQDIAFDANGARVYLGNDGGVYRTIDGGTNWTFASGNLAITQFYDIDISERDRDICAGGAQDNGVYYRNAAGTWRHIPWGDGTQVAIDPTDPEIFYFSSQNGLPGSIRKSVDGGASHQQIGQAGLSGGSPWITIIKLEPRDPIPDPENNRVLFVCGTSELFRSVNGGQNWQRVENGSGSPFQTQGGITALEFARSDPRIVYLATSTGAVYRATGGGANAGDWDRIDTPGSPADALFPFSRVQAIRVNPSNPNDVWLVFGGSGVSFTDRPDMVLNPLGISHIFRNADATDINGWHDASGRFPAMSLPDVPTSAVALADFSDRVAYAGTDVGVFRTTDGGDTWTGFQDGLPRSPIAELRFNRACDRLFAGTMGRGVYARDV